MTSPSSRNRIAAWVFGASVVLTAALIASQVASEDKVAPEPSATAEAAAGPVFDEWAKDAPDPDEGKGKLIGHVERDGQMIEVRQLPPDQDPDAADDPALVEPGSADQPSP